MIGRCVKRSDSNCPREDAVLFRCVSNDARLYSVACHKDPSSSHSFILRDLRPLDPRVEALPEAPFPSPRSVCAWQKGRAAIGGNFQALVFHSPPGWCHLPMGYVLSTWKTPKELGFSYTLVRGPSGYNKGLWTRCPWTRCQERGVRSSHHLPPRCLMNSDRRQETNKQMFLLFVNFIVKEKKGYCVSQSRKSIQITHYFLNDTNQCSFLKQCFALSLLLRNLCFSFPELLGHSEWEDVSNMLPQSW